MIAPPEKRKPINNQTSFSKSYTYYFIQSTILVIMDKQLEDYWMEIF